LYFGFFSYLDKQLMFSAVYKSSLLIMLNACLWAIYANDNESRSRGGFDRMHLLQLLRSLRNNV